MRVVQDSWASTWTAQCEEGERVGVVGGLEAKWLTFGSQHILRHRD